MNSAISKSYEYCGADLECEITSFNVDCEDNMGYTTYGIRITDSFGGVLYDHPNISTDKSTVENFIMLCETHFISIVHVDDVLEDYLF